MSGAWDIATATSIGTGTSKTQINGGNNITKPTRSETYSGRTSNSSGVPL